MKKKKKILTVVEPYIWLLPSMVLMAVFILVPIFEVFKISMSNVSKAGIIKGFVGLANFQKVLKGSTFPLVLKNTLVWTVVVVGLSTLIGFILAIVLNNQFRGRKIARAIVVFPWATSLIIQAGVWKFIIDTDYGALNTLLMRLGIIEKAVNWTPTPGAYFAWECWVGIFVTVPFVMFCVLSGLQSIDSAYYEAATVDGATYWQKLFQITVPLVKPSLTVSTVLNIIYVFNSFPIIWTITKGDPANRTDTLVTYLYKLAFYNGKSGEAAAVSVIGFLILCVCASVYMVVSLRKEGSDE
jgi:multiple sugar transport system permease protein